MDRQDGALRMDVGVGMTTRLPLIRHSPWYFCLWIWAKASFDDNELVLRPNFIARALLFRTRRLHPAAVATVSNPSVGKWLGVLQIELTSGRALYLGSLWNRKRMLDDLRAGGFPVQ